MEVIFWLYLAIYRAETAVRNQIDHWVAESLHMPHGQSFVSTGSVREGAHGRRTVGVPTKSADGVLALSCHLFAIRTNSGGILEKKPYVGLIRGTSRL